MEEFLGFVTFLLLLCVVFILVVAVVESDEVTYPYRNITGWIQIADDIWVERSTDTVYLYEGRGYATLYNSDRLPMTESEYIKLHDTILELN